MTVEDFIRELSKIEDKTKPIEIQGLFSDRKYNCGYSITIKDGLFNSIVLLTNFGNSEYSEK